MKTQEFFNILEANKSKTLLFEYAPTLFVAPNYHITEVKHVSIDAVDCGTQTDAWLETIIQLWESPEDIDNTKHMSVQKALSILNKVGHIKPYNFNAELKIEYSNTTFNTAQLYINTVVTQEDAIIFKLAVEKTNCKAQELCGAPEANTTTSSTDYCNPNSGCC